MVNEKTLCPFIISLFLLVSCRFEVQPKDSIVKENIFFNTINNVDVRQTSFKKVFVDDGVLAITDGDEEELAKLGARKIRTSEDWKHIGFQFMASGKSTECKYLSYETIDTKYFSTYLIANDGETKTIFDFLGNIIKDKMPIESSCKIENDIVVGELGEKFILEYFLIDKIYYYYKIDKNLLRSSLNDPIELYKNPDGNFCKAAGNLFSIGYPGHIGQINENGSFNSDFGASFIVNNADFSSFCWKSLMTQHINEASPNGYDYVLEGKYYTVDTNRIDVIDGNSHHFDFNYLIFDSKHLYDENGQIKNLIIKCYEIKNKEVLKKERCFVVDNCFKIVFDATDNPKYSFDLERLNEYDYFSPRNKTVFDYAGDVCANLKGEYITKSNQESIFLLTENNEYKICDYNGNNIVRLTDIKDVNISSAFYRCGLLVDKDDSLLSLDMMNGYKISELGINSSDVLDTKLGILVKQSGDEVIIIGYNGETLTSSPGILKNIYKIDTVFHSDAFCFIDRGTYTSVLLVSRI